MVGKRRRCDTDYPPAPLWKDFKYEYDRGVFSVDYAGRGDLFEGLSIWEEEKHCKLQGTYPVISLSFASVKERDYPAVKSRICQLITDLYIKYSFIRKCDWMTEADLDFFDSVSTDMP